MGPPFSFSWGSITYTVASTNATDLKISASNPGVFFKTDGVSKHNGDWWLGDWTGKRTDRKDDFWGNPNGTAEAGSPANGTKSIFDPLPQRLDGGLPGSLQGGARRQGRRLRKEQSRYSR